MTATVRRLRWICVLNAALLVLVSAPAQAFDLTGGVSVGGMLGGGQPRLAISPHIGISWVSDGGFMFAVREMVSFVPASNKDGMGVYSRTSANLGYASQTMDLAGGPSISLYSMPSCRNLLCGRASGLAAGGHAQATLFFLGPVGVFVSANVDWIAGSSLVISEGVAATIAAGLVLRWTRK